MAQTAYQFRSSPLRELLTEQRAPDPEAPRGLLARCPVTFTIGTLICVFFWLQSELGGTTDQGVMIRLGAVRQDLVFEHHELYRLLCPAFLHGGLLHIILNGLAFLQLGVLVELLYGRWRFLAVYLLSAVGGTVLSASFMPLPSVGASGAILGLAGLLLGTSWFGAEPLRTDLKHLLGRRLLWAVVLTFGLGLSLQLFWVPIIDNLGHLGGLLTGIAFAALQRDASRPANAAVRAVALLMAGLTLVAFGWMAVDGGRASLRTEDDLMAIHAQMLRDDPALIPQLAPNVYGYYSEAQLDRESDEVARAWVAATPEDPSARNSLAWHLVTRPNVALRDPGLAIGHADAAVAGMEEAVREAWGGGLGQLYALAAALDTRAVALRAVGRVDEARLDEERAEGFWNRLVREQPSLEGDLQHLLWQSYLRGGQETKAERAFWRWLILVPNDDRGLCLLAEHLARQGPATATLGLIQAQIAVRLLEEAGAARRLPAQVRLAEALSCEARILRGLGRAEQARATELEALGLLAPEQAPQLRARLEAGTEQVAATPREQVAATPR